jgi:LmbE family N-acetylglucosaminyl deacetylase
MTPGDLFGKGPTRINELHAAMDVVGLQPENRILLDFQDGGLHNQLVRCCEELRKITVQLCPSSITVTAFEAGHSDHDILNFAVCWALKESGIASSLREFPLYNGSGSWLTLGLKVNSFPDTGCKIKRTNLSVGQIVRKWKAIQCYKSQPRALYPLKIKFITSFMKGFAEPFRDCPPSRDHCLAPYDGKRIYQEWFNSSKIVTYDEVRSKLLKIVQPQSDKL